MGLHLKLEFGESLFDLWYNKGNSLNNDIHTMLITKEYPCIEVNRELGFIEHSLDSKTKLLLSGR